MSWAGKKSIVKFFRSLFRKEQAPSDNARKRLAKPLTPAQLTRLEAKLNSWVEKRGYCLPDHSIHQTAARMGTDSVKLYRYFAMKNTDFRTWRTELRMKEAAALMQLEPKSSISVIGRRVGIADRSNFCRQFKAIYGETPDIWRKNQK